MPAEPVVVDKPPFKPNQAEVLAFGAEKPLVIDDPRIKESQEKIKKLREFKSGNNGGREVFERMTQAHEVGLGPQELEGVRTQFGANQYERLDDGSIKTPDTPLPGAKENFDVAGRLIDKVSSYLQYADEHTKQLRGEGTLNPTDYQTLRNNAIDAITTLPAMHDMFPEINDLPIDAKRDYIEATLGSDPKLRVKVAEKMRAILEEAQNLPVIEKDPQYEEAQRVKTTAETRITNSTARVIRDLEDDLPIENIGELKDTIQRLVAEGKSAREVLVYTRGALLHRAIPADVLEKIRQHNTNLADLQKTEEDWKKISKKETDDDVKASINEKRGRMQKVKEDFESDTTLASQYDLYNKIIKATPLEKDPDTQMYPGIGREIQEMTSAKSQIDVAQETINAKGSEMSQKERQQRQNRLLKEAELVRKLEMVLPGSVAEVLIGRYDEMILLENQRIAKDEEEATKRGDEKVANGIKAVGRAMNEKWIHHNERTRQKTIHRDQLGTDIRRLAYQGEDGVKRLILRELKLTAKDTNGNEIPISWQTVNLSTLSDENKRILNEVHTSQGEGMKQKLINDYFLARKMEDTTLFGIPLTSMALKDHELALLEQHFGSTLEEGLSHSEAAKTVIKELEGKGIKPMAGLKWLLFFFLGTTAASSVLKKVSGTGEQAA